MTIIASGGRGVAEFVAGAALCNSSLLSDGSS